MSFVHLHNHSHYSLLDGLSKPEDMVLAAKEQGAPAVALTDHGVLYGAVEFYKAAKKHDIKPIIGCEMYITDDRFAKDAEHKKSNHLLMFAKDEVGYANLLKLVTEAHLHGFYYKPRIDHKLLEKHIKGLIATSTCLVGELPQAILNQDQKQAEAVLDRYLQIFGRDNFYLEVQDHPKISEQALVNKGIFQIADKTGLKVVATNDCHYTRPEDAVAHDILVCIQTGKSIHDDLRMRYDSNHSMRTHEDLLKAFKDRPDAISNTLEVAEKIDLKLEFGQNLLPHFPTPNGETAEEYLRILCEKGLKRLYKGKDQVKAARERLDYELKIIVDMGFADYFLIVEDFISFARKNGIVVGPGRGSAAGSIIAYTLGITSLDPLEYGLLFERFLNPERVSMPDIDIDFADHRRDEIIQYVKEKYGEMNVAQVITFGTMAAKAAVRDVGRAMGYPYSEVDTIAKKMPPPVLGKHAPLEVSVKEHPELRLEYENNPRAKELLDNAMKLEGTVRNAGTHACAVIISEQPITDFTPLQYSSGKDDTIITQYSMKPLEEIGLLKMDFLGLRNLTIMERCLGFIKKRHDVDIDLAELPEQDEKVFKLLTEGKTTGIFQLESGGMKRYLKQLKPTRIGDIIAMNALYRPGPMEYIPDYINGKHDPETVKYMHELFEPILEDTYGVCVYQEQLLQIARSFAGFSLGEADILRKAVGKKNPVLLAEQKQKFVGGAVNEGHDEKFAEKVFTDVIEPFAGYGFNKAHAACYAMIAYQTAYLKAHYPTEFMASLLVADQNNTDRLVIDLNECALMNVKVLPPHVNESDVDFTVVDDGLIRFGLAAIKGVGTKTVEQLISERKQNGEYASLEDLAKRVDAKLLNKKSLQSLAYAGALDVLGDRLQIAEGYDVINSYAKQQQKHGNDGQMDIFGAMPEANEDIQATLLNLPKVAPQSDFQMLKWEKEYLGLYVSKHPLQGLGGYFRTQGRLLGSINEGDVDSEVVVHGLISAVRTVVTKRGDTMAIFTVEDPSGSLEVVAFPRVYAQFSSAVVVDKVIQLKAKVDQRRDLQLIAQEVKAVALKRMKDAAVAAGVFDENEVIVIDTEVEETVASDAEVAKSVMQELEDGSQVSDLSISQGEIDRAVLEAKLKDPQYIYEIFIKFGTDPTKLKELKNLLKDNPGDVAVALLLQNDQRKVQKMQLKQGIDLQPELVSRIEGLVG